MSTKAFSWTKNAGSRLDALRWAKPGSKKFQIEFRRGERYEPDFVVETKAEKHIVETKVRRDLEDATI